MRKFIVREKRSGSQAPFNISDNINKKDDENNNTINRINYWTRVHNVDIDELNRRKSCSKWNGNNNK